MYVTKWEQENGRQNYQKKVIRIEYFKNVNVYA